MEGIQYLDIKEGNYLIDKNHIFTISRCTDDDTHIFTRGKFEQLSEEEQKLIKEECYKEYLEMSSEIKIMEDNKYYISDIEELHIGYEFEKYEPANPSMDYLGHYYASWDKRRIINPWDILAVTRANIIIRTKYLDKEDIESLGYRQLSYGYQVYSKDTIGFKKDNFTLVYDAPSHILFFFEVVKENNGIPLESYLFQTRFFGNIKNKSELKKLMKQLNIK